MATGELERVKKGTPGKRHMVHIGAWIVQRLSKLEAAVSMAGLRCSPFGNEVK